MAQIVDIIDELELIANAFTSVNSFYFDEIGIINTDKKKSYPCIIVDSRNVDVNPISFTRSNLPNKIEYSFKMFFLDPYEVSEQKTKTRQQKYSDLLLIANQYIAEVKRRTETYDFSFTLKSTQVNNGFIVDKVHNDVLCQLVYSVVFTAQKECVLGTFDDMDAPLSEDVTITINGADFTTAEPFTTENIIVKNSAGTAVGSKVGAEWIVPNGAISADSSLYINDVYFDNVGYDSSFDLQVKNSAGTQLGADSSGTWQIADIDVTDSDGTTTQEPAGVNVVCTPQVKTLVTKFYFESGDDVSPIVTIDSSTAGTYTSIADDGASGTITLDINSGGFGAFVNPTTLVSTDTIQVKRTITTADGNVTITGTYS